MRWYMRGGYYWEFRPLRVLWLSACLVAAYLLEPWAAIAVFAATVDVRPRHE